MRERAVILLGRYPTPGKVKTRLAAEIGSEKAAEFYRKILEELVKNITNLKETDLYFYAADAEDISKIEKWLGGDLKVVKPESTDIELNLRSAFEQLFKKGYQQVISVASDVPSLDEKIVDEAFNLLTDHDVVIGPDNDGGIYLFGSKKPYSRLYKKESRNKSTIFEETIEKLKGENIAILDQLIDVDTKKDLDNYLSI